METRTRNPTIEGLKAVNDLEKKIIDSGFTQLEKRADLSLGIDINDNNTPYPAKIGCYFERIGPIGPLFGVNVSINNIEHEGNDEDEGNLFDHIARYHGLVLNSEQQGENLLAYTTKIKDTYDASFGIQQIPLLVTDVFELGRYLKSLE